MWFYLVAFVLIIILLILLSMVWPPDSPWSPWWRTDRVAGRAAAQLAKITKRDVVYELGSGDGELSILFAKEYGARVVGIEIDPTRFLFSQIRKTFSGTKNVTFLKKDFKEVNLSNATLVYFYLVPRAIQRLLPKLKKELKKGTHVLSYRFPIEGLRKVGENKEHKFYLYKI